MVIESRADDSAETQAQLRKLQEQNASLQEQLRQQQALIESLTRKVNDIEKTAAEHGAELPITESGGPSMTGGSDSFVQGKVVIGGEGGVAFFKSQSQGMFPNGEFRLDEARLFLETPVWEPVYFYGELNLATREEPDVQVRLGEAYLDVENISRLWNQDRMLNLRMGRMYIPYGEEYQYRYAIDNPLISHSLSDLWGVDEGIELYGQWKKFGYAIAVQNGGISDTRDYNPDKSVAGRLQYDPNRWLHFSASAMRTGDLNVKTDNLSAMWFANGFFRSLGSASTTTFNCKLVEGDAEWRFTGGHLKAFGGYIHYDDNDPTANNQRDVYYYSVEGVHDITRKLYVGVRFSQIFADKGFPIVANGTMSEFLFGPLTDEIWRLSLGIGYRWSKNLLAKTEYTFEQGKLVNGVDRDQENLFAVELAYRF
jgi:hypothetical protein